MNGYRLKQIGGARESANKNYKELAETAHRFKNEGEMTMQGTQMLRDFVDKYKGDWYDEGYDSGYGSGYDSGVNERQRQIAISMLNDGMSEEVVCKYTGFDISEVVAIKNEMQVL